MQWPRIPIQERFWARVKKTPGCWLWDGWTINGYGRLYNRKHDKAIAAHRLSYEIHWGPIPNSLMVRHLCGNPRCVRPSHLCTGTAKDNADDCRTHGRINRGVDRYNSLVSEADVRKMRQLWASGISQAELGRRFGMHKSTARLIVLGKTWRHVR